MVLRWPSDLSSGQPEAKRTHIHSSSRQPRDVALRLPLTSYWSELEPMELQRKLADEVVRRKSLFCPAKTLRSCDWGRVKEWRLGASCFRHKKQNHCSAVLVGSDNTVLVAAMNVLDTLVTTPLEWSESERTETSAHTVQSFLPILPQQWSSILQKISLEIKSSFGVVYRYSIISFWRWSHPHAHMPKLNELYVLNICGLLDTWVI